MTALRDPIERSRLLLRVAMRQPTTIPQSMAPAMRALGDLLDQFDDAIAELSRENAELRVALTAFITAKASLAADNYDGIDELARSKLEHADALARSALHRGQGNAGGGATAATPPGAAP